MENTKIQELTIEEMKEVNGGSLLGSLLIGLSLCLGMLAGKAVMALFGLLHTE